eukprot:10884432-Heterocapsa_arctica.AAC.1
MEDTHSLNFIKKQKRAGSEARESEDSLAGKMTKSNSKKADEKLTTCYLKGDQFYKKYISVNMVGGLLMEMESGEWHFCDLISLFPSP